MRQLHPTMTDEDIANLSRTRHNRWPAAEVAEDLEALGIHIDHWKRVMIEYDVADEDNIEAVECAYFS